MATVEVPGSSGRKDMADSNAGPAAEAEEVARHRRKFLTGGLAAGAAALGAWSLTSAQSASADTGDPLIAGQTVLAGQLTGLLMEANPYSRPGFDVATNGQGAAIQGENAGGGPGVRGISISACQTAVFPIPAGPSTTSACAGPVARNALPAWSSRSRP